MPNEDYNANFDALLEINLKKIYESDGQQLAKGDFEGLRGESYIHTEELIRDLEELHFIETEYEEGVYFLTEQGYLYIEQEGLDSKNDTGSNDSKPKKKSNVTAILIIALGLLALLYAANMFVTMKEKNNNQPINNKPMN